MRFPVLAVLAGMLIGAWLVLNHEPSATWFHDFFQALDACWG